MTLSKVAEIERRRAGPPVEVVTFAQDLIDGLRRQLEETTGFRFPDARWWAEPVGFYRRVLGVEPWSRQIDVMHALRDHPRVAVKSGRKVSKSNTIAGTALCYYCSFEDAQVVLSSTTARQVDQILWTELRKLKARSGRCVECKKADPSGLVIPRPCPHSGIIDGDPGELARTGLKSEDFRSIVGFTAKEAEAVQGVSGKRLLYLLDEASGIADGIYEAIEGNRAGGARLGLFGNPTKTSGEFFAAFGEKKRFYFPITISSEESPNVVEKREVIEGLATHEWIEEKREEWGEESALYKVHIKGEFATREDGKIFSVHTIAQAEQRWPDATAEGRLYVGLDPAGESGTGDDTVFCPRRGLRALELVELLGLTAEAHVVHLLGLIKKHALPRERAVVVMDREGSIGAKVYGLLSAIAGQENATFELVGLRSSERAHRQPAVFDRLRDELAYNLESWFRDGGAIPANVKLARELHELEWKGQANGRVKLTAKDQLRKVLGRSPDRYDALALATWEPLSLRDAPASVQRAIAPNEPHAAATFDPYAGARAFERR
jgi:phage terminase large subunit